MAKASNASLPVPGTNNAGIQRASSVTGSDIIKSPVTDDLSLRNQNKSENLAPFAAFGQSSATTYNAPEEPLKNAEN